MMKTNKTLRYENVAKIGDMIHALDFEPCPDRPTQYVIGRVISFSDQPVPAYVIVCVNDCGQTRATEYNRVGREVFVPFETFMDYDGRVFRIGRR